MRTPASRPPQRRTATGPQARRRRTCALLAGMCLFAAGRAAAQEGTRKPDQPVVTMEHRAPPWEQRVGAFLGATLEDDADPDAGFTFGLDYEWRFHQWYGIGGFAEAATSGNRDAIVGPALLLHPVGAFRLALAPSAERALDAWHFTFRLGFVYDFAIRPKLVITPSFALDFTRGKRLYVLGVSAARIF